MVATNAGESCGTGRIRAGADNFAGKTIAWRILPLCLLIGGGGSLEAQDAGEPAPTALVNRVALGSCANQDVSQPIWDAIVSKDPDLFLFLGDNVYADTEDMGEMREAYAKLGRQPGYRALLEVCPVLAIWDDHDYGVNDGGAEFPMKEGAEAVFHEFFGTPADSPVRSRPGIYDARYFDGGAGRRLQILLLDTRYFRGELVKLPVRTANGPYTRTRDTTATVLGDAQWKWLGEQLKKPADIRIIATSIQFLPQDHRWELWENFPHERKRMLDLLRESGTGPVIFVSGDRHMGELMKLSVEDPLSPGFPVFEMTSSGLTNAGGGQPGEKNRHRISPTNFQKRNFGLLQIDWEKRHVRMELCDVSGKVVDSHVADLNAER